MSSNDTHVAQSDRDWIGKKVTENRMARRAEKSTAVSGRVEGCRAQ